MVLLLIKVFFFDSNRTGNLSIKGKEKECSTMKFNISFFKIKKVFSLVSTFIYCICGFQTPVI